ncbi:unnamed protein product [Cuscuta campestris]|uniref:DUF4283 domain-containing protein n=1 Tax=Cuscuta campestris TaxID=132261 RepID=A0A484L1S8_9ASTE|nr:unnamed protein product [Cuscuta campestris]
MGKRARLPKLDGKSTGKSIGESHGAPDKSLPNDDRKSDPHSSSPIQVSLASDHIPGTYSDSALVCCIFGANPPLEVVDGVLLRIWRTYRIHDVSFLKEGQFIVRFQKKEDRDEIIKRKYYYMDNKVVYVQEWYPGCKVDIIGRKDIPNWIQLPDLDMKYWGLTALSKFGSSIGQPIMRDKATAARTKWTYACIQIEVQVNQNFPDQVHFINEEGRIITQAVVYEWAPTLCSHCSRIGHMTENCRRKKVTTEGKPPKKKPIWRQKTTQEKVTKQAEGAEVTPKTSEHEDVANDSAVTGNSADKEEEFTEVSRKKAARRKSLEENEASFIGLFDSPIPSPLHHCDSPNLYSD